MTPEEVQKLEISRKQEDLDLCSDRELQNIVQYCII